MIMNDIFRLSAWLKLEMNKINTEKKTLTNTLQFY